MSGFTNDTNPSKLGGGVPGAQPLGGLIGGGANSNSGTGMVGSQARGMTRQLLRRSAGKYRYLVNKNIINSVFVNNKRNTGLTPFRQVYVAGDFKKYGSDPYSAQDPRLPTINQINGLGPTMLFANGGGVKTKQNGSTFSGNPKYVYDSSDYTRFKNLQAQNSNYNDLSFGGDQFNASYPFLMAVRS